MYSHMPLQRLALIKLLGTDFTDVAFHTAVHKEMPSEICNVAKLLPTCVTYMGFLACMHELVHIHFLFSFESLVTEAAFPRSVIGMSEQMAREVA